MLHIIACTFLKGHCLCWRSTRIYRQKYSHSGGMDTWYIPFRGGWCTGHFYWLSLIVGHIVFAFMQYLRKICNPSYGEVVYYYYYYFILMIGVSGFSTLYQSVNFPPQESLHGRRCWPFLLLIILNSTPTLYFNIGGWKTMRWKTKQQRQGVT